MTNVLFIGLGGFLGASSRFGINQLFALLFPNAAFPYATMIVNLLGCLLFGIIAGMIQHKELLSTEVTLFLLVGFLGSLTTFSTYGFETLQLLQQGQLIQSMINIVAQTCFGVIFIYLGMKLAI